MVTSMRAMRARKRRSKAPSTVHTIPSIARLKAAGCGNRAVAAAAARHTPALWAACRAMFRSSGRLRWEK
ncbi:hypothetical protein VP06_30680 [Methylobacterium aquaticum]|uniref:Uncharacterized protein n=1 Tax=Methylobacterium aquaticum TaxID=270351 RepID=A0A0J6S1E1_9HYPH|nr:hypothetical protein VP06_30680 [Methylobacterium aquaticum]